jgi:hypothetical protein
MYRTSNVEPHVKKHGESVNLRKVETLDPTHSKTKTYQRFGNPYHGSSPTIQRLNPRKDLASPITDHV